MSVLTTQTLAGLLRLARALPPHERDLAVDVCADVIAMAPDLPGNHPGRAARCGAQLLLGLALPGLSTSMRDDLAHSCEVAVVRGPGWGALAS